MNIHKQIVFLYGDTKYQEMEIVENINNSKNKMHRDRCNNKVYLLIKLMDNFNEIPLGSQQHLALFIWKNILTFLHGRIKFLRNAKKVPKNSDDRFHLSEYIIDPNQINMVLIAR